MKKLIVILFIIMCIALLSSEEQVVIPNTAIRFRIIANSNSEKDQNLKMQVKKDLEPVIKTQLASAHSIEEARLNINSNLLVVENVIKKHTNNYAINFGTNYFPEKEYKNVTYPEGEYESLVITLGNGLGDNWWCVLFPPLCLLEAEESKIEATQYKFYVKELIDKYMN